MKKNISTQYSNRESAVFYICSIICIFCACLSFWLFLRSFNESLFRQEAPIGTITFKYKTAQRKFFDMVVWDRLRQESPVYNGDTVRVAPLSEATITFTDNTVMTLAENTMLQVFFNDENFDANLSTGNITVDSSQATKGLKLNSGDVAVKIEAGSSMSASSSPVEGDNGGLVFQMLKGVASIFGVGNGENTIEEGSAMKVSGTNLQTVQMPLIVTSPSPDARILYHTDENQNVLFTWENAQEVQNTPLVLELSTSRNFTSIAKRITATNLNQLQVSLGEGIWYYRITSGNQVLFSNKFQLYKSLMPNLVIPSQSQTYTYRKVLPSVRFMWSESRWATSYLLEIADNEQMLNPIVSSTSNTTSAIINTLEQGKYYWRVTPFYAIGNKELPNAIRTSTFVIEQSGELKAPYLLLPVNQGYFDTKEQSTGTVFSWKRENEAKSYRLLIADNNTLSNPVVNTLVNDNFYNVKPSQNIYDGNWYWGVSQIDIEGNESAISEIREFTAAKSEIIQRSLFPPDGYSVDISRLQDMSFTWKTNLPYTMRFQVAKDSNFTSLVYNEKMVTTSFSNLYLQIGKYYWRVIADAEAGVNLASTARILNVLPPLDPPSIVSPTIGSRVIVEDNKNNNFEWQKVDGAGYYKIQIFSNESIVPIFEKSFIENTNIDVDMNDLENGNYRWTIQPFTDKTTLSSRRIGKLSETNFNMKKLVPVKLVYPAKNAQLSGVDAILKPDVAKWTTVDSPKTSSFVLWKVENGKQKEVARINNPKTTVQLPRLQAGDYVWTINAITIDDYDISAIEYGAFKVLPTPPLAATTSMTPSDYVFDVPYIRNTREIKFNWNKVSDATSYILRITSADGKSSVEEEITEGTSYLLEDLAVLSRGDCSWSIQALRRIEDATILQTGTIATSKFKVDLPVLQKPKLDNPGTLYGQ